MQLKINEVVEGLDYLRNNSPIWHIQSRKQGYDTQSKIAKGVAREHKNKDSNEINKTCPIVRYRERS